LIHRSEGLQRRTVLVWLGGAALAACQQTPRTYDMQVSRDVGCPCCHVWTELMEKTGRFKVTMIDVPDLQAYKQRVGVPAVLGSCHTAVVDGLVVEGHVPASDILRLLDLKPKDVIGIAVPGMPRGSPGMEQPNGAIDAYEVMAFDGRGRQSVFGTYARNT
jgi:hypothetical protein